MNFDQLCTALLSSMRIGLQGHATIDRAWAADAHMVLCDMDRRERSWAGFSQAAADAAIMKRCRAATVHRSQVFVLRELRGVRLALLGLDQLHPGDENGSIVNPWCLMSPAGAGRQKLTTLRALKGAVGLLQVASRTLNVTFMGNVTERNKEAHAFLERVGFRVNHGPSTFAVYELER